MRILLSLVVSLIVGLSAFAKTERSANVSSFALLRHPTVSKSNVVFEYAGDLWSVAREGGEATHLTTNIGIEDHPAFSPDGSQIAFTGEYDGNIDVFVMPATGGVPKRLTWHPAPDLVLGWTPDGKRILFASPRTAYSRFFELFTVSRDGGFPERLPLPTGFGASYSPDGKSIAYMPLMPAFEAWKHYRGGRASSIWLADLQTSHIDKLPRTDSNDFNPMWTGDKVYFLSDRNGPVTLFSYDLKSRALKQLIENRGLDMKSASLGPDAIVYEQFGSIHLYDLRSGKAKLLEIHVSGDLPELREHRINVSKKLTDAHISPTGMRAVFASHGEILTVPAEKGDPRNLTNTPGVMERSPIWSPDGKTIAYLSDESGEYQLHVASQNGMGAVTKISLGDSPAFYAALNWSPDSKKISYVDSHHVLWYIDLTDKKPVRVDKDYLWTNFEMAGFWSPDSKWLAYSKRQRNYMGAIFLYSLTNGKSTQLTDGMSDAHYPVFDKSGKYLFFAASTDSGPALQPDIQSGARPITSSIYLAVLSKADPSPFAPESDEEAQTLDNKPDASDSGKSDKSKPESKKKSPVEVKIDFDNISQRILAVDLPALRYIDLQVGPAGMLYASEIPLSAERRMGPPLINVHRFDLGKRKSDVLLTGVTSFEISDNGEKMLTGQGDRWTITAARPMADKAGAPPPPASDSQGALKTESLEVLVNPAAEWKQMYQEAWRIERDFFYDPGYHGLSLKAAADRYQPYVGSLASREDLNYLFREMMGELTVGHLFVFGGDEPDIKHVDVGLLGADYKIENGRYRFERVYNGENWNPQLKAPLTQPGVNVVAGEYLLAVNGRDVRPDVDVYSFFEATAGKAVLLKVGPDPSGVKSREVKAVPIASETNLRELAWIEGNRRKVDAMTNGRVAYIYMPDTSYGGYTNFNRYFFAQVGKEAAIIDERYNGGGALATDVIEYLKRQRLSLVATRDGADEVQPQGAIFGPKVMIINETAGSGGDAMPWYFRRAGVGKLIGKRTWGGLVGIFPVPNLMDGGMVTAPNHAVWNPNGKWDVENHGVDPDIEVEFDPELVRQGHDPQLDRAVQEVLLELKDHPLSEPKRPPYPNYHRASAR